MASWPSNPTWTDPTTINAGNQYNAADGVTADDINTMVKDLIYIREHGGIVPTGTLRISADGTYDVASYETAVVSVSGSEVRPLTVNPETTQQIINAPAGVAGYNPVTVNGVTASIDPNIVAENIKQGVSILGVAGTLTPGITPTGNQDIDTLNQYDVTSKATAQVSAAERAKIIPENIKKDVTILGVTGTHEGGGGGSIVIPSVPYAVFRFYYDYIDEYGLGAETTIYAYKSNTPFTGTTAPLQTSKPSVTVSAGSGYFEFMPSLLNPSDHKYINFKFFRYDDYGINPKLFCRADSELTTWQEVATNGVGIACLNEGDTVYLCVPVSTLPHSGSGSGWNFSGKFVTYMSFEIED